MDFPIVYSSNEKYIPYLSVSIQSIIENMSDKDFIHVFILYNELSENSVYKLKLMESDNLKIDFINVLEFYDYDLSLLKSNFHYSKEMYNRFLIPEIFGNYKKILYVDCDLVFNINPVEYYKIDIGKNLVAAVNDIGVCDTTLEFYEYVKNLGLNPEEYINSGVLIMNIEELNNIDFLNQVNEIIKEGKTYLFPDQDILNIICKEKVYFLDYQYNFQWAALLNNKQPSDYIDEKLYLKYFSMKNNPYLIHYTGGKKPWHLNESYLSDYFWKYAKNSPFYEDILFEKIFIQISNLYKYSKFDLYKYKIKSLIPNKKQKHYKDKYEYVKKILKEINKI